MGAIAASGVVYLIASGREGLVLTGSNPLATNGFGAQFAQWLFSSGLFPNRSGDDFHVFKVSSTKLGKKISFAPRYVHMEM